MPGELKVKFVQMGQGDCTIIKCPDDKIIMIDCGSDRYDHDDHITSIEDDLWTDDFINNPNNKQYIDLLILTHPDSDHHNKIARVLSEGTSGRYPLVDIGKVYFSGDFSEYYKGSTSGYIKCVVDDDTKIRTISFNSSTPAAVPKVQYYNRTTKGLSSAVNIQNLSTVGTPNYKDEEYLDADGFVRVLEGQFMGDPKYTVSILSSNINEYTAQQLVSGGYITDDSECISSPVNSKSIVVKIEYDNVKILICGDATMHTEKFLIDRYSAGAKIRNMNVLQVPHHGSTNTSSTSKFINCINPKAAFISSAYKDGSHNLPSATTLYRIEGAGNLESQSPHYLYYWVEKDEAGPQEQIVDDDNMLYDFVKFNYNKNIQITGSNGTQIYTVYPD